MTTENNNLEWTNYIKQQLFQKILENLSNLPGYKLTSKQRDIFIEYAIGEISKYYNNQPIANYPITNNQIKNPSNNQTKNKKKLNLLNFIVSFWIRQENDLLIFKVENLFLVCITGIFLVLGFLTRTDIFVLKFIGGISLVLFELLFIKLGVDFFISYPQINRVFRYVKNINNYIDIFEQLAINNLSIKADVISKNIIEDEISSIDSEWKKLNVWHLLVAFFLSIGIVYISGNNLIILLQWLANKLNFQDFKFIKGLNQENLIIWILFPLGAAFSRDFAISSLQRRNKLLKQSLLILENQIQNRIESQ